MIKKLNKESFIEKAKIVHKNSYDYSSVEYINSRTKIKINCETHGIFEQIPNNHLSGSGCPICNKNKAKDKFNDKASLLHNNKYDYLLVKYVDNKTKVKIICPIHGEFEQTPNDHLTGCGCSLCGNKNLNKEIFIKINFVVCIFLKFFYHIIPPCFLINF